MRLPARIQRQLHTSDNAVRTLVLMNAVNSLGDGAFAALSVIYLATIVGLTSTTITSTLALAGAAALLVGIPIGILADRTSLKRVFVTLCLLEGASVACFPWIKGWSTYLPVVIVGTCAMRATAGVRNALIARSVPPERRVQTRALLRSVTNAGTAVGAGAAGLMLVHPQRDVLAGVFYADALTFVLAAALAATLRVRHPLVSEPFRVRDLAKNGAFLTASLTQAGLSLHGALLTVALPLWIATRTQAPESLYGFLLSASTILAVLLQVPVARLVRTTAAVTRATLAAGVLIGLMCLLLAGTGSVSARIATLLISAAVVAQVLADLLQSTAGWSVSFAAPPPGHEATYQATYSTAFTVASAVGPALSGWIVTRSSGLGWVTAAVGFTILGYLAGQSGRMVLNRRATRGTS